MSRFILVFFNSATKIFAPFCPFFAIFSISQKMFEKVRNFVAILTNIAKKDKKKLKIFVALLSDIATRRGRDILTMSFKLFEPKFAVFKGSFGLFGR